NTMRHFTILFIRNEHAIDRHAMHKALRAIEWIENPTSRLIASLFAILFAQNQIVRKVSANALTQILFRLSICARDGTFVSFRDYFKIRITKIFKCDLARAARDVFEEKPDVHYSCFSASISFRAISAR